MASSASHSTLIDDTLETLFSDVNNNFVKNWQFPRFSRYDQVLRKLGYPMDTVYENLGLDVTRFSEISSGVSAQDFLSIIGAIVSQTEDTRLGVKLGSMRIPRQMGVRFYIALFSKTLRLALKDFLFYCALEIPLIQIKFNEGDMYTEIQLEYAIEDQWITFEIDVDIISIVNLIRELLILPDWSPKSITTTYALDPARHDALSAVVRCPIAQKDKINSIVLPSKFLDYELKFSDPYAKKIMIDEFNRTKNRSQLEKSFVSSTAYYFVKHYEHYGCIANLKDLASYFNLSETHYQRALIREGTNFRRIRGDFTFKMASMLIRSGLDKSIIANRLGYSGLSSFSRFFNSHEL